MQGGYVAVLVSLLVTICILGFVYVKWLVAPSQNNGEANLQPLTASGTVPTNQIERYQADIDDANSIQDTVNINTQKINQSLEVE